MTGVINNISGKIMYINITPNLVGIIKNDTKKTELKPGEKIQVIIADLAKKDENKYIFLKKVI